MTQYNTQGPRSATYDPLRYVGPSPSRQISDEMREMGNDVQGYAKEEQLAQERQLKAGRSWEDLVKQRKETLRSNIAKEDQKVADLEQKEIEFKEEERKTKKAEEEDKAGRDFLSNLTKDQPGLSYPQRVQMIGESAWMSNPAVQKQMAKEEAIWKKKQDIKQKKADNESKRKLKILSRNWSDKYRISSDEQLKKAKKEYELSRTLMEGMNLGGGVFGKPGDPELKVIQAKMKTISQAILKYETGEQNPYLSGETIINSGGVNLSRPDSPLPDQTQRNTPPSAPAQKTRAQRIAELKAEGITMEEGARILKEEGYDIR